MASFKDILYDAIAVEIICNNISNLDIYNLSITCTTAKNLLRSKYKLRGSFNKMILDLFKDANKCKLFIEVLNRTSIALVGIRSSCMLWGNICKITDPWEF